MLNQPWLSQGFNIANKNTIETRFKQTQIKTINNKTKN